MICSKCQVPMKIGYAIDAGDDWTCLAIYPKSPMRAEDVTLVNCWKCPACGHSQDITWKNIIYSDLRTVDSIAETVSGLYQSSVEEISEFIKSIDVTRVNHLHALAILRMNFARRSVIDGWYGFRDQVYEELKRRGVDADRSLGGLFKD